MKLEALQYRIVRIALEKMQQKKYPKNKPENIQSVLDNHDNLQTSMILKTKLKKYMRK